MLFSKFKNYECESPIEPDLLQNIQYVGSESTDSIIAGDREIVYRLQSLYKNGAYNSTIRLDYMQPIFDYMSETKAIRFRRARPGENPRLIIEQSNRSKGTNIFAWANGNKISLSPDANYGKSVYTTAIVFCHEFLHCAGGSGHSKKVEPLMAFNGGTTGGFTPQDEPWWKVYQWRGAARPILGGLRAKFGSVQSIQFGNVLSETEKEIERIFFKGGCGQEYSLRERLFGITPP